MMRALVLASIFVLGACSEGGSSDQKAAGKGADAKVELAAGQWESVSEVTSLKKEDQGASALKLETGSKTTVQHCVGEGEGKKPNPALIAGLENASCEYQSVYMSRGRLNASMSCRRPGLSGQILVSAQGTYTDKSFDLTTDTRTLLVTDGDISFAAKVTGRHTGPCSAAS